MFWPTDSHGNMEPDMKPFWHLGIVASSFVMLGESTENTLYNMAQVANVTQLVGRVFCCLLRNCDCRKTGAVYRAWSAFRCRLRTLKMTSFGANFFRDTNNLHDIDVFSKQEAEDEATSLLNICFHHLSFFFHSRLRTTSWSLTITYCCMIWCPR